MALEAGSRLGPYEIVGRLGSGGMGEVYRARDPRLGRDVAIKVLPEGVADPRHLRRFEQEARAAGALNHPSVLAVYDVGSDNTAPYVVSELLEGHTLRVRLEGGPLPARKALDFGLQIARGLAAAHDKGIVHRDLKPQNVFLTEDGRAKILDFGLAKLTRPEPLLQEGHERPAEDDTESGTVIGTAGYMSPEQVRGEAVDHRSDIFSFGAVLYEMLSGVRAFRRDSAVETMNAILKEDPPELSATSRAISPGMASIVRRCLEKRVGDRFHSTHDLALALEAAASGPAVELLPVPDSHPPRRFSLRRPWVWFAAAAVLVAAGLSVVRSRWPSPDAAPPKAVPLTSLQGIVTSPSLSPDGTYVVFGWNGPKKDNPDLYVQQIGVAAPPLRLTSDPADDYSPSWSPDGRTIAFLRRGPPGGQTEVWRIAPLGGLERKVAETRPRLPSFPPAALAWCPDSTCLLVTDTLGAEKPDALFQISLETGERRQLTHPQSNVRDTDPGISPDGEWLVFRRSTNPGSGELYRLSLKDGKDSEGDPVRLTSPILWPTKPAWIPDSRDILFSAKGGLFRLDAMTGATPSRVPFVDQDGRSPVVSRVPGGGRRLVYVRALVDTNVWRVDTARPGAPAASPPAAAIASTRLDMGPAVTADGRRVVFASDRSGENEFWVADPDGSNAFQLTSMAIAPGFPRWSPDQAMIVFHGNADMQRNDAMVVPARGGQPRNITKGMAASFPSFSRDGQWIYFSAAMEGGVPRIWKMAATGGAPVQVTDGLMAIESYDGDLLYLENMDGAVWRLPRGGGAAVKVVEGVLFGCFDVVEGGLYYIDRVSGDAGSFSDRPGGDTRLRYFDFATSQSTTVASNLGAVRHANNSGGGLSATRDGRTVFFARTDSEINELMLVDDFR